MASPFFTRLEELIKQAAPDPTIASASKVLADIGSPSTLIAVLDNGEISSHCISTKSHDTETLFQACSISKPIGGLMMMKLVELGHFGIDDKMVDLLPADIFQLMAQDTRKEALLRTVTMKHLMSHTSGLSIHGFPGYPDPNTVPSLYQILEGRSSANTQPITMKTLPGLEFMYSGGGITVLQCIVEHIMKRPFPELMKKYIFDPLGMSRSLYHLDQGENNVAKAHYHGYTPAPAKWHIQPELAAAGLWTTPTDLLKVVRAVQDCLEGSKSDTILKKKTAELMLTVIKSPFGLTWMADSISFGHGGSNFPGYECHLLGFADLPWNKDKEKDPSEAAEQVAIPKRCGISIMTNAVTGFNVYHKLVSAIAYLKGWAEPAGLTLRDTFTLMPFPTTNDSYEDRAWEEWIGDSWEKDWIVAKDEDGHPRAGIDKTALVKLRPAAIPPSLYPNGKKSIDFVMDGVSVMLRFGWDKGKRTILVCNAGKLKAAIVHSGGE